MSADSADITRLRQRRCWAVLVRMLLAILLLILPAVSASASEQIVGVASVIDGDTIEIHGTRIRLHGIDAPGSAQLCQRPDGATWRCGQQAALALQDHIGRRSVTCGRRNTDRYGRVVGQCSVEGRRHQCLARRERLGGCLPALRPGLCERGAGGAERTAWDLVECVRDAMGLAAW